MRLSGVEAVARAPLVPPISLPSSGLSSSGLQGAPPPYADPIVAATSTFADTVDLAVVFPPCADVSNHDTAAGYADPAGAGTAGCSSTHAVSGLMSSSDSSCVYGSSAGMSLEAVQTPAPSSTCVSEPQTAADDATTKCAAAGGYAPDSVVEAAAEFGDNSGEFQLRRAVDAKLRELVPGIRAADAVAAAAIVPPSAATGGSATGGGAVSTSCAQFGLSARGLGTAALRISRQELDARVQQILGRHGQVLAELGNTPAQDCAYGASSHSRPTPMGSRALASDRPHRRLLAGPPWLSRPEFQPA